MNSNQFTSCMDEFDPTALQVEQAVNRILESIIPVQDSETLVIDEVLNRVLFRDIVSGINIPPYSNSAMDGYAVRGMDLPRTGHKPFKLAGTVRAGAPLNYTLRKNDCIRIMTGAKVPEGADTVIMQEHVKVSGDSIEIGSEHQTGQNVRLAGEDISAGQTVLLKGKRLTPADIGLLASIGIEKIEVYRKLRVAFFSTGDELTPLGQPLEEGQIYDSNRYSLRALLRQFGATFIDLGVVKDNREKTEETFIEAANKADVLITTGGVSVGDADYVKDTLQKLGTVNFWKIAMKPGRPLAFGKLDECLFFGLPGNPVSTIVTFLQFVAPGLRKLQNETTSPPLQIKLRCMTELTKKTGRTDYQRGVIERNDSGEFVVRGLIGQGSHMVGSMSRANCLIVLPPESTGVEKNSFVDVQPFYGLMV